MQRATQYTHSKPVQPVTYTVGQAAKMLGVGERKLFAWLRAQRVLNAQNIAYQRFIDTGYFVMQHNTWHHPVTGTHYYARSELTNKGIAWLEKTLTENTCQPKHNASTTS